MKTNYQQSLTNAPRNGRPPIIEPPGLEITDGPLDPVLYGAEATGLNTFTATAGDSAARQTERDSGDQQRAQVSQALLDALAALRNGDRLDDVREDIDRLSRVFDGWAQSRTGGLTDKFPMMTAKELADGDFSGRYIIDDFMAELEFCILVGPKKSLKTTLAAYLACCIAIGRTVFGIYKVTTRRRVGFFSGESGKGTVQDVLRRIAMNLGRAPSDIDGMVFTFAVPQLDDDSDIMAIEKKIREHNLEVVFLDCFYRMLGEAADDVANVFKMGRVLAKLLDLQQRTGCTVVLLHHTRMHAPYAEPDLDSPAFAGTGEAARQWILIARRSKYDPDNPGHHELYLTAGGSMGHSEIFGLNIDEGSRKDPSGRRLDIEVIKAGKARAEAATASDQAKEERRVTRMQKELDGDREAILVEMRQLKKSETKTGIRDKAGVPPVRFDRAWASLTKDKTIVLFGTIRKGNNQPHDGYCLAKQEQDFRSRQKSSEAVNTGSDGCIDAVVVSPLIGLTDTDSHIDSLEYVDGDVKPDGCKRRKRRKRNGAKQ